MKILFKRWLLLPIYGLYEILLLIVALVSSAIMVASDYVNRYSVKLSQNMLNRAKKLPSFPWYIGK